MLGGRDPVEPCLLERSTLASMPSRFSGTGHPWTVMPSSWTRTARHAGALEHRRISPPYLSLPASFFVLGSTFWVLCPTAPLTTEALLLEGETSSSPWEWGRAPRPVTVWREPSCIPASDPLCCPCRVVRSSWAHASQMLLWPSRYPCGGVLALAACGCSGGCCVFGSRRLLHERVTQARLKMFSGVFRVGVGDGQMAEANWRRCGCLGFSRGGACGGWHAAWRHPSRLSAAPGSRA